MEVSRASIRRIGRCKNFVCARSIPLRFDPGRKVIRTCFGRVDTPINAHHQFRCYAAPVRRRLDGPRLRQDVDDRARLGFYSLHKKQGILLVEPSIANSIYQDFVSHMGQLALGDAVKRLATKYNIGLEEMASIAILTWKTPDLSDPVKRSQIPPSQHKSMAISLLKGCAEAEEPLAVVQILTAQYLRITTADPAAKEITSSLNVKELAEYKKTLSKLGAQAGKITLGPDVLTLQGLFAEAENKPDEARSYYADAIKRSHLKFNPKSTHPMQMPMIKPWNALGYLLRNSRDPELQEQAKDYFQVGATQADDPLSYYELSTYQDPASGKWLQCTSKAAASGHRQAMVNLAEYYEQFDSKDSGLQIGETARKSLSWLLNWKSGTAGKLAREWFAAASAIGHKPSSLKLADYHESVQDRTLAELYLYKLIEPPSSANQREEWPQLVQMGKKRLEKYPKRAM